MSSYGKNFDVRIPPVGGQRASRYSVAAETPIGVPVVTTGAQDTMGRSVVALAAADADKPAPGEGGVLFYEAGPDAFRGKDDLTVYSDISTAPAGKAVQVVNGNTVKVVLKNTAAHTFLHSRAYPGRMMVAGIGATPTLVVGDFLCPGTGTDVAGYWKKTTDPDMARLVVTSIDSTRDEAEARLNF